MSLSPKQLQANQGNAKKGGVKTDDGKAVSRFNAVKHGLLSKEVLMKDEDENSLLELQKRLRQELKPATEMELLLVDRISSCYWRLKRALSFEKDTVIYTNEFSLQNSFRGGADVFFRYEAMLERSIYKALHELQRLQAARSGEIVPPPIAIDVDVSSDKQDGFVS